MENSRPAKPRSPVDKGGRAERLAAELRVNLKRRKAAARRIEAAESAGHGGNTPNDGEAGQ